MNGVEVKAWAITTVLLTVLIVPPFIWGVWGLLAILAVPALLVIVGTVVSVKDAILQVLEGKRG